ncbi:MAG TPA: C39 family peptidase [Coleofasciculaceae cyanobacterium]
MTELLRSKKLGIPYLSQRDNVRNPGGSCNVTSIAMCLRWAGYDQPVSGQLEDVLYNYAIDNGLSRHDGYDLATLFNSFAQKARLTYRDDFTTRASMGQIKRQLTNGFPVVIHGYFTRSGHIIVATGFDDDAYDGAGALVVNDPWGEWHSWGYDTSINVSGKGLLYSYGMIERLCTDPGKPSSIWAHIFSKL